MVPLLRSRYGIRHMLYVMVCVVTCVSAFHMAGLLVSGVVLGAWALAFGGYVRIVAQGCVVALAGVMMWSLFTAVGSGQPSPRSMCVSHARAIMLALKTYHDEYGTFPPAVVRDANGKALHSWRALILKYLDDGSGLHARYRFDEPWDGPNNAKLVSRMPEVYRCPATTSYRDSIYAHYMAVVDVTAAWDDTVPRRMDDFGDNADATVMIIECHGKQVVWTQPEDLSIDEALVECTSEGGHGFGGFVDDGPTHTVGMCSGYAIWIRRPANVEDLRSFFLVEKPASWDADRARDAAYRGEPRVNYGAIARVTMWFVVTLLPLCWVGRAVKQASSAKICG